MNKIEIRNKYNQRKVLLKQILISILSLLSMR